MKINIRESKPFQDRHIGPSAQDQTQMLKELGLSSMEELISQTIPASIRLEKPMDLPEAKSEAGFLADFERMMGQNKVAKSYIGMGYHDCITPGVIQRNILENPGWYTAYTPYQAEIAQGRLEMLLNYQTMVTDLTGMELANASLLDEATAAAEALHLLHAHAKRKKKGANKCIVSEHLHPQTIALIQTRMAPIGVDLDITDPATADFGDETIFGLVLGYPDTNGEIKDIDLWIESAKANNIWVTVVADLLSLTLLKPPGEMGADIVVGSAQRFGVPMGYGGPHAAYFATKEEFSRLIPGRIIGVSKDMAGKSAMRMALQTREQHIKREKATSNICTAQVLLAVMASAYGIYHGPEGLKKIAARIHGKAVVLSNALTELGFAPEHQAFFDTLKVKLSEAQAQQLREQAETQLVNFRYFGDGHVGIALDETTTLEDLQQVADLFAGVAGKTITLEVAEEVQDVLPERLHRSSSFMTHPVFDQFHSEHEMLRYLKRLENKDLSLTHSMISLGSCTMKLNATSEMVPVTWPTVGKLHPYAPLAQAQGYQQLFRELEQWLCEVTGFAAVSLQPNSGAQGEYAGLMTIRGYHHAKGDTHRDIVLIPSSAHGTNPASGVMAGMKVVIVKCDEDGNVDLADLKAKAEKHSTNLAALMVTYPSTHGVFEEDIIEICDTIHQHGGRVYMDGANMNAQVGLTNPARIGADVCHLNLHKTFCIPHGGGGPGMGPIGVVSDLAPFLPGNPLITTGGKQPFGAVSAAPWGSASILPISYAYIAMMGPNGLKEATEVAILNANYIKERLKGYYEALYIGKHGRAAHEMIIDCRVFKKAGVEVEDIAKRLMDYGYHAPTVSFPVPGTMMIEPTESEAKTELDRFCDVMIQIRHEIAEIESGEADAENNVLKNAPHTADLVINDEWHLPYSREKAAYPLPFIRESKFWPSVRRIDNAYGDRNLMCSCIPVEEYSSAQN